MEFDFDLFFDCLWLGTICGIISTLCMQKIKGTKLVNNNKIIALIGILVNLTVGFVISRLFTNLGTLMSLEVGILSWIGAEAISDKIKERKEAKNTNDKDIQQELTKDDFRTKKDNSSSK